ncbi:hypothetical protein HYH02_010160 [Chlamydomonas schloesseri]|uniref:Uncharacterized protein n=1 Tax=Chlamydomonas schloesseri TaxID=2026947 RepID=A0A835W4S5_9CHLO|nr:hypothetical protein HYH02_010160 [Chlamydomonas schloesseri]|eukprot:KAG2440577.1 hypothetical protein HYH02_010160 [Chlamydomonas schloesseri]
MAYVNQPEPQPPYPCCAVCGAEARCFQTRSESSANLGRWFFKCPEGHKNRFFWADEWRRPGGPGTGTGGHPQPATQAGHGGLPQPQPPPQYGYYDNHGSPRFGAAAAPHQGDAFNVGQGAHQHQHQPPAYPQTPQQQRQAPPPMQSPPAAAGGHVGAGAGANAYVTPQALTGPGGGMPVQVQVLEVAPGDLGLKTPVYHEPFRNIIMELPWPESGRHWDKAAGVWHIKSTCYLEARDLLTRNGYQVQDAPARVLDILVKRTSPWNPRTTYKQAEEWVLPRVEPELWGRLFAYQREGVLAGVRFGGRVLFADEMGLGKTVQALTLMSCYPEDWPLLVICPTSLRFAWAAAVQQWLPPHLQPAPGDLWQIASATDWDRMAAAAGIEPGSVHDEYPRGAVGGGGAGGGGGGRLRPRPHIAIVSYDLAVKMTPQHAARYRSIICDECHALKNRTTQRAQKVGPLVRAAARAALCTGTAILNRPIELYTQVDMLKPGLLGSYTEYGERYCVTTANAYHHQGSGGAAGSSSPGRGGRGGYGGRGGGGGYSPAGGGGGGGFPGQEYTGANALGELKAVLGECAMVRRRKEEVLGDLPPKIRSRVPLQPCEDDLRAVGGALRDLKRVLADEAAGRVSGLEAKRARQQAWSAAYRATGPAKLTEAKAFLSRLLERDADDLTATQAAAAAAAGGGGGGGGEEAGGGGGPCKVLVFAHHQEVLNGLQEHLQQSKVMHMRIDGSTPPPEREKAVAAFQRLGPRTPRVALLSLHAAGTGLTLTAATVVVFVELDQSPALLVQAEDRAHRVGQAAHVHVYYLMAKGTLDEQIWAMLDRKRFVCGAALDGGAPGPAAAPAGHTPAAAAVPPGGTPPGAWGGGVQVADGEADADVDLDLDLEGLDVELFEEPASGQQQQQWAGRAGAGAGATGTGAGSGAGGGSQTPAQPYNDTPRSGSGPGAGAGAEAVVSGAGGAAAAGTQGTPQGAGGAGAGASASAGAGRGVAAAGGSHSEAVAAMRRNLFWDSDDDDDDEGGAGAGGGGARNGAHGGGAGNIAGNATPGMQTPPTQPPPASGYGVAGVASGAAGSNGAGGSGRLGSQPGSGLGSGGLTGETAAAGAGAGAGAAGGYAAGDVEVLDDDEEPRGAGGGGSRGGTQNSSSHLHSHADTRARTNTSVGGGSELRRRQRQDSPPYPQTQALAGPSQQQRPQPGSQQPGGSSGSGRRGGGGGIAAGGGSGGSGVVVDLTQADEEEEQRQGSGAGGQQAAKRRKAVKVEEIVID